MHRKVEFSTGSYYHLYNRGADKRPLFADERDFARFYLGLFAFNDLHAQFDSGLSRVFPLPARSNPVTTGSNRVTTGSGVKAQGASEAAPLPKRKLLVDIVSFILMPNHFHLFVEQKEEAGISRFLHRLQKGYSRYFNLRHQRSGTLVEGGFKAVNVNRDAYFEHLPRYIHLNALDLTHPQWRTKGVSNWREAATALDRYRWSSHHMYVGKPQELPVVTSAYAREMFSSPQDYLRFLRSWATKGFTEVMEHEAFLFH